MTTFLFGVFYDALPLIPLALAFVWTLRYQRVADLSLAGSFAVSASCTAYLLQLGYGAVVSIAAGLLVGLTVGLAMAAIVNLMRIEPLLAGLVVLFITYSLSLGISSGHITIPNAHNPFAWIFAAENNWGSPLGVHPGANLLFLLLAVMAIAVTNAALGSEWGCAFRALEDLKGGRPFLTSLGISPVKLSSIGFAVAGTLAAASGILVGLRDRQATSALGTDTLIDMIPAYLLGLALFELKPTLKTYRQPSAATSATGQIWERLNRSKFRFGLNSLSSATASALGVIMFYGVINLAQRGAFLSFLPKVIVGLSLIVLLGAKPAYKHYAQRRRQGRSTATTGSDEALEIKNLSVSYPTTTQPKRVLNDVNLVVQPREIVLLKGANGSGKSTLLRALTDRIDCSGSFKIPATNGSAASRRRATLVAYVSQDADENLATTLSIAEQAVVAARGKDSSFFRSWRRSAAAPLSKLGIDDVAPDSTALLSWLSGGQKRRVLLGLLAVRNPRPRVVVLDEPFNDLDAPGRDHCSAVIRKLAAEGCAILLIDHQEQIPESKSVDLAVLSNGKNGGPKAPSRMGHANVPELQVTLMKEEVIDV